MDTESVFDLDLKRDTFITFLSKRASGKTVLVAELIYYFLTTEDPEKRVDYMYMFSRTAGINKVTNSPYSFIDDKAIFHPDKLGTVVKNLMKSQIQTGMKYHILIVLDDIMVGKSDKVIDDLATEGRHYNITVILSSQIANRVVSPMVRNNADYIFWRRLGLNNIRDDIFPFMDVSEFQRAQDVIAFTLQNTSDYKFIVYNNKDDSDVAQKFHVVRANPVPEGYYYKVYDPEEERQRNKRAKRPGINWD